MNKLAIVGTHPATRDAAPWGETDFDIWVFNEAAQADWCKRWSRLFQLHKPEIYTSPNNMNNAGHWQWLQQAHGKPIYMQAADPLVPDSVEYPLEHVRQALRLPFDYFELSAAYAMALALTMDYREVHVWGMDLVSNTEYTYQAACWRFWIGFALGRGVRVVLHCNEGLFNTKLYGYDGEVQLGQMYFTDRASTLRAQWSDADRALHKARDAFERAVLEVNFDKAAELAVQTVQAAMQCGVYAGALAEAEHFAGMADTVSRQHFEKRAAQNQRDGEGKKADMQHLGGQVEYIYNAWRQTGSAQARAQFRNTALEHYRRAYAVGAHNGAFTECITYLQELDARIQAAGGAKSVQVLLPQAVEQ